MPAGMLLRSNWTATQIASPQGTLTLEAYQNATGDRFSTPVPVDRFVGYGLWYRCQAVPDLDPRTVVGVERADVGFSIALEDGEVVLAVRVIVAVGVHAFAWCPPQFEVLPSSLASHTSAHQDFTQFSNKHIIVVGGGQSALESGALLHESGATVEVVTRSQEIHWLQGHLSRTLHHRLGNLTRRLLYAPTDVGPAGISQLMARPNLLRRFPRAVQEKLWKRAVRPAGARWLVERLRDVPIRLGSSIASVAPVGERVKVQLSDGTERTVDHILLGTGYRVDIAKYRFLAPELLCLIRHHGGYPCLEEGLETSVRGLHIIGAPAAWSFGPLMQFVSGTTYASQALMHAIVG